MPKITEFGGATYGPETAPGAAPTEVYYDENGERRRETLPAERRKAARDGEPDPVEVERVDHLYDHDSDRDAASRTHETGGSEPTGDGSPSRPYSTNSEPKSLTISDVEPDRSTVQSVGGRHSTPTDQDDSTVRPATGASRTDSRSDDSEAGTIKADDSDRR